MWPGCNPTCSPRPSLGLHGAVLEPLEAVVQVLEPQDRLVLEWLQPREKLALVGTLGRACAEGDGTGLVARRAVPQNNVELGRLRQLREVRVLAMRREGLTTRGCSLANGLQPARAYVKGCKRARSVAAPRRRHHSRRGRRTCTCVAVPRYLHGRYGTSGASMRAANAPYVEPLGELPCAPDTPHGRLEFPGRLVPAPRSTARPERCVHANAYEHVHVHACMCMCMCMSTQAWHGRLEASCAARRQKGGSTSVRLVSWASIRAARSEPRWRWSPASASLSAP